MNFLDIKIKPKDNLQANKASGFSLTELSITLVIMSLIIAAVLSGQSLIRAAKIRTIVSEIQDHKVSVSSFYAKFNAYPGDFKDASAYFGTSAAADGNNSGSIDFLNDNNVYESYKAWQHLSLAGFENTKYAGTVQTSDPVPGVDVPPSKSGGAYLLEFWKLQVENNAIYLANLKGSTSIWSVGYGVLPVLDAQGIDSKIDDGNPQTGKVKAGTGEDMSCDDMQTCACMDGDYYMTSAKGKPCVLAAQIPSLGY